LAKPEIFALHKQEIIALLQQSLLCHLVCHLHVQFNTNNTDIWNNAIHRNFLELIDFSVSCWLNLYYERTKIFFLEDFKSLASFKTEIDLFPRCKYVTKSIEKR